MAAFMSLPGLPGPRPLQASAIILAALLAGSPALADALIVNASSPDVETGRWLRAGDTIKVDEPMDLTVLEAGSLRVIRLEEGHFTYEDAQAEPEEPKAMMLASVVSGLLSPDEDVVHIGATRGGRGKSVKACPETGDPLPAIDLNTVMSLSDSGCDEAAKAVLDRLIGEARAAAGLPAHPQP